MEENHPIEKLMVTAMDSIKEMVDVNTIIGNPIKALDNTVIIPISKVGFGFAAGGSEFNGETVNSYNKREKEENIKYRLPFGGGSGAGVNITPVAFLIVQNDNVKLLEASHASVLDKLVEYIPDAVEKIDKIIKKKMDNKDESDDEFEDDIEYDFDDEDDLEDNYDEDLENDIEDESNYDNEDDDFDFEEDEEDNGNKDFINKEDVKIKGKNKIKEIHKKEINQIVGNNKGKVKKLEEKIEEIKDDNDQ